MFDKAPDKMLKLSKKGMTDASRKTVKHFKAGIPSRFRTLTSYKVSKLRNGNFQAKVGLFDKNLITGKQPNGGDPVLDWYKAYWHNYGTLGGRDPNHHFRERIKNARKNRLGGYPKGIKARNFFEQSIVGWEKNFLDAFREYIAKHVNEL